jgi:hypothetical protein
MTVRELITILVNMDRDNDPVEYNIRVFTPDKQWCATYTEGSGKSEFIGHQA